MKKILALLKQNLFLSSKLIKNYVKIDYLYYFVVVLFFYILLHKFADYIISVKNYSLLQLTVFFLISTCIYFFVKVIQNKILKDFVSGFLFFYGKLILVIYFVLYVLLNVIFFDGILSFFFLYSTIFLFLFYSFLRFIGVKFEYNLFKNDIKSDDIFSFYTIYIVLFLFVFSFLFSTDFIPDNLRYLVVIFGFLVATFCFIIVFNNEIITSKINFLYSRKNKALLRKVKIYGFLIVFTMFVAFGYFFGGDIKNYILSQNVKTTSEPDDIPNEEIENIISDLFENSNLENTGSISSSGNIKTNTGVIFNTGSLKKITIGEYYNFDRYIGLGNYGEDVEIIQEILTEEGFYTGALNGNFDEKTSKALDLFIETKTGTKSNYEQLGPKTLQIFKNIEIER